MSLEVSVEESYKAFSQFLDLVRVATNNDTEILRKLQHTFNKVTHAYRSSIALQELLRNLRAEIESNKELVFKTCLKLVNACNENFAGNGSTIGTNIDNKRSKRCALDMNVCNISNKRLRSEEGEDYVKSLTEENRHRGNVSNFSVNATDCGCNSIINAVRPSQPQAKKVCMEPILMASEKERINNDDKKFGEIPSTLSDAVGNSRTALADTRLTTYVEAVQIKKKEKQIERLEKLLLKLDKEVKKLQAKELCLDDMEDDESAYVMEDRYKRKIMKVWDLLCKLKGRSNKTNRCIEDALSYNGSPYPEVNKKVEKLLARTKEFPDFQDIFQLIQRCNEKFKYNLGKVPLEQLAKKTFVEVGRKVQERRKKDFEKDFGCYMTDNVVKNYDPADRDHQLLQQLESNQAVANQNMENVIETFALRQEEEGDSGDEPIASEEDDQEVDEEDDGEDEDVSEEIAASTEEEEDNNREVAESMKNGGIGVQTDNCDLSSGCTQAGFEAISCANDIPIESQDTKLVNIETAGKSNTESLQLLKPTKTSLKAANFENASAKGNKLVGNLADDKMFLKCGSSTSEVDPAVKQECNNSADSLCEKNDTMTCDDDELFDPNPELMEDEDEQGIDAYEVFKCKMHPFVGNGALQIVKSCDETSLLNVADENLYMIGDKDSGEAFCDSNNIIELVKTDNYVYKESANSVSFDRQQNDANCIIPLVFPEVPSIKVFRSTKEDLHSSRELQRSDSRGKYITIDSD